MRHILYFFAALFTEDDANKVPCPARIGWGIGLVAFIGFSGWHICVNRAPFDMQAFGTGFGVVNLAGGGGLLLKGNSGE